MSTTKTYSGYDEARPTSKVICPPGGRSSNIFGTEPTSYPNKARGPAGDVSPRDSGTTANRLFGEDDSSPAIPSQEAENKSSPAPAAGGNSQVGNRKNQGAFNPITGEDYTEKPNKEQVVRERQPPGGRSSGPLW